jgi:hypothetical protein
MSAHHTSPLRPHGEDLLKVNSHQMPFPNPSHTLSNHFPYQRPPSQIPSPYPPIFLASLPPNRSHHHHRMPIPPQIQPPLSPRPPSHLRHPLPLSPSPPSPSRPKSKRHGEASTMPKCSNGAGKVQMCVRALRRNGHGGRNVARVSVRSSRLCKDRGRCSRRPPARTTRA